MEQPQRLIFLAATVAWAIFRLVRYLRISAARHQPPAIPPSVGARGPLRSDTAAAPSATTSPIEPEGDTGAGLARKLLAAAVFIPGTVVIWSLLFMLPAIEDVPPVVRGIAGVLATLYLIQLARGAAARLGGTGQSGHAEDSNPIK
ncbi:MAG TPA: hypothetical protein VEG26_02990 [Steroidobacteraceae bacterium]|nr:hypothetical protein [Steroidobacteraceae bacterium]